MHNFRKNIRRQGRDFTGLEHHGAAYGKRRRYLAGHLIHWPIPGRDKSTNANRFFNHPVLTQLFNEVEGL